MKKIVCVLALAFMMSGCGLVEKFYEDTNYESLTNERGDITLYSGGKLLKTYPNCKIIYSDSNSTAIWFKTKEGERRYWQGDMEIKID